MRKLSEAPCTQYQAFGKNKTNKKYCYESLFSHSMLNKILKKVKVPSKDYHSMKGHTYHTPTRAHDTIFSQIKFTVQQLKVPEPSSSKNRKV